MKFTVSHYDKFKEIKVEEINTTLVSGFLDGKEQFQSLIELLKITIEIVPNNIEGVSEQLKEILEGLEGLD